MAKRPVLGITMGDPAGIGPEISVKALMLQKIRSVCTPILIGDAAFMARVAKDVNKVDWKINAISNPSEAKDRDGIIDIIDQKTVDETDFKFGRVSAMCGEAAFAAVRKAIELALAGEIDGTVTNALNKEAINLAGHKYDGHTEIYADLTRSQNYAMMLADEKLRVVHCTTHIRMTEVAGRLTKERILEVIRLGDLAVRKFGVEKPRVAVAGYNPHAGESGLFGSEEIEIITPAVNAAKAAGYDVTGPVPPDTVFCKAAGGAFDLVVAMYHDQGHIPMKLLSFKFDAKTMKWSDMLGVNITLGLPIIRTSVDHGTAFGHAGMGLANPNSLIYAIECGALLAKKD